MEEFQDDSNEEVYTLKTINQKLKVKYGDSLRFMSCECQLSTMLLHEEADQILLESSLKTVSNSCNVEKDLKDFVSLAEILHNVCKKAVNVKNSILILATLL